MRGVIIYGLAKYKNLVSFIFLLTSAQVLAQLPFKESTFNDYAYPKSIKDEQHTRAIRNRASSQFPHARTMMVASYITTDWPRKVVDYYSHLSGQRFFKYGQFFTYIFSEIDNKPATRIDIYPMALAKTSRTFWPTRIDLYLIRYPISVDLEKGITQTKEELKNKVGRLYYDGILRTDIALLDMEELGSGATVYVIETDKSFAVVSSFFRRRYGGFHVTAVRDGDVRAFQGEFDATYAVGLNPKEKQLIVNIEENPLVIDRVGNSQIYRDKVFIKYIFWNKETG